MLRNAGQYPTRYIIQELAYAETLVVLKKQNLGNESEFDKLASTHKVANVFKEMSKRYEKFSVAKIYLSAAVAFSRFNDIDGVVQHLKYVSTEFFDEDLKILAQVCFYEVNEIYFSLLDAGQNCNIVLNEVRLLIYIFLHYKFIYS